MRILQIINSLGTGGAEKLILDSIPLYRKEGIEMDVLLLWDNNFQFTQRLKEINCCKIYILSQSNNYRDIYSLSHILKIRKIIKKYDLIHVHLFPAQYFVALANIGIHKKILFTEHSTSNRRISNRIFKFFEKWCYSRYDKLICISEEVKRIYINYLGSENKIVVINNGVDLHQIQNALPLPKHKISTLLKENDKLIIQVSGFREEKDQDTVIRSLLHLPENYIFLIVGDGVRYKILESLVLNLNLQDRVLFLGQRMDVPNLLRASDFVVLSSHYEGLSLASVEGLASGKPFIASDVKGLTEVVKGAGALFPEGADQKLAEIILELSKDQSRYEKMTIECVRRSKHYDISLMIEKHISLYKYYLEKHNETY